jgi:hypothetical protein
MKPGIPSSVMTNEQYHANPAISRSGIKLFNESPFKFWAHYLNPDRPEKKQTEAMQFGSAFHKFILEHDSFYQEFIIEPELQKLPKCELLRNIIIRDGKRDEFDRQKKAKDEVRKSNDIVKEEFAEIAEGKIILTQDEYKQLITMRDSLRKHHQAWSLIQGAKYEESYFWQDEHSGLMVKCRPDILRENAIIDLKTCTSADSKTYQRDMYLGDYHTQGAIIREGVKQLTGVDIPTVINISIEKTYPYEIGIKIISQSALEAGHMKFKNTLLQMKECFQTNTWDSYEIEEVELPKWST